MPTPIEICCPGCGHTWEETWEEEVICEDTVVELEEQLEAKDKQMAEMREFLKSFVDEFDKTPGVYSVNRVLTKAEIQKMRRLVEST